MASFFNRRSKLSKIILLSVRPYKLYICEVKIDQSEDSKNMLVTSKEVKMYKKLDVVVYRGLIFELFCA